MELHNIAALSRPRPATRFLTAQALDPTVLEALYFVLALVDDDHEAKQTAELFKRMREAAPPRPAPPRRMKARRSPCANPRACSRPCLALPVGASERASGLVVA
jgi:hypothetical protein